jgi:hypothetical protein
MSVELYTPSDINKYARGLHCAPTSVSASASANTLDYSGRKLAPPATNLYLRLFASTALFTLSTGKITVWQGTGTSGRSFIQSAPASAPVPGASINGKTTVDFTSPQLMFTDAAITLGVFDIYVVCKTSAAGGFLLGVAPAAFVNSSRIIAQSAQAATVYRGGVGTSKDPTSATWLNNGVACMVRHGFDGTHAGHILQRNGVDVAVGAPTASGNPGTSNLTDFMWLGRASGMLDWGGSVGEVLIYNAAPDASRAAQVHAYCKQYWGTP